MCVPMPVAFVLLRAERKQAPGPVVSEPAWWMSYRVDRPLGCGIAPHTELPVRFMAAQTNGTASSATSAHRQNRPPVSRNGHARGCTDHPILAQYGRPRWRTVRRPYRRISHGCRDSDDDALESGRVGRRSFMDVSRCVIALSMATAIALRQPRDRDVVDQPSDERGEDRPAEGVVLQHSSPDRATDPTPSATSWRASHP